MKDCLFCKIIDGVIPSKRVYEDDNLIIINDINPQAKCHYLMIPKTHFDNIADFATRDEKLLGKCLKTVTELSDKLGLENGYRIITNKGSDGCQSVNHVHFHILGGEKLAENMNKNK